MNQLNNQTIASAILNHAWTQLAAGAPLAIEEVDDYECPYEGARLFWLDDPGAILDVYLRDDHVEGETPEWFVCCTENGECHENGPLTGESLKRAMEWLLSNEDATLECSICAAPQPGIPHCPVHSAKEG